MYRTFSGSPGQVEAAANRPGFMGWAHRQKHRLMHLALSGLSLVIALRLVNNAHKHEDQQDELRKLLKQEVRIKKAIVARAPELAIDAGLPVAQQATFKASLQVLASQLDAEPPNDTAADHTSRADSGTSTAVTTPLKKGVAVW